MSMPTPHLRSDAGGCRCPCPTIWPRPRVWFGDGYAGAVAAIRVVVGLRIVEAEPLTTPVTANVTLPDCLVMLPVETLHRPEDTVTQLPAPE